MNKVEYNQNITIVKKMEMPPPQMLNVYVERYFRGVKCLNTPEFHKLIDTLESIEKMLSTFGGKTKDQLSESELYNYSYLSSKFSEAATIMGNLYSLDREKNEYVLKNDAVLNANGVSSSLDNIINGLTKIGPVLLLGLHIMNEFRGQGMFSPPKS